MRLSGCQQRHNRGVGEMPRPAPSPPWQPRRWLSTLSDDQVEHGQARNHGSVLPTAPDLTVAAQAALLPVLRMAPALMAHPYWSSQQNQKLPVSMSRAYSWDTARCRQVRMSVRHLGTLVVGDRRRRRLPRTVRAVQRLEPYSTVPVRR